jgi:hypothetical protein
VNPPGQNDLISASEGNRPNRCSSCGKRLPNRRRYCRPGCQKRFREALQLSTGLLTTLRAAYAAVHFSEEAVVLDVVVTTSKSVSRFQVERGLHEEPATALYRLINEIGTAWHEVADRSQSRGAASRHCLDQHQASDVAPETAIPAYSRSMAAEQKRAMRTLELTQAEIESRSEASVRQAQRKAARKAHPDIGGTDKEMKTINGAVETLLEWLENPPSGRTRIAFERVWCFSAAAKKWYPPA